MSTDLDARLQAAFRAAAAVIGEPVITHDPQTAHNHGRLTGWFAPLAAAASVLLALAGSIALIHTVQSGRPARQPITNHPASSSSAVPTTSSAPPPAIPDALTGPGVGSAQLLGSGVGYARTGTAVLVTADFGASWKRVTPDGLSQNHLASAAITFRPDGMLVIATVSADGRLVTVYRRAHGNWSHSTVSVTEPAPLVDDIYQPSLSFSDNVHGWLVVGRFVTHTATGVLLRTDDGGASWVQTGSPMQQAGPITTVSPLDGFLTWLMNGWTYASHDGGATWSRFTLAPPSDKRGDTVQPLGQPAVAGSAVVVAARFSTADAGTPDGIGLYRSADRGLTWSLISTTATQADEADVFTVAPDGSYVLLRTLLPDPDGLPTWTVAGASDIGRTFQDRASATQVGAPAALWSAGGGRLWALAQNNGCLSFKSDCYATSGILASSDGGVSWRQLRLPS